MQQAPIQSHLQQVLNYLKQGHATLPPQPVRVPSFNPTGNMVGTMPVSSPQMKMG